MMLKDELEAAIKSYNLWSGRSTLVLAVGILGEYVLLPFLNDKKLWHKTAKRFSAILVVAGIVGEYEFSARIAQDAEHLQILSGQTVVEATDRSTKASNEARDASNKARDAIIDAGAAKERAANVERANLQLRKDLETATAATTAKQVELEVAQLKTAVAQREVAQTQGKVNGAIISRLLDRHVDARLKEALKTLPSATAEVRVLETDREAVVYAIEIRNALIDLGWRVSEIVPIPSNPSLWGVKIVNRSLAALFLFGPPDNPGVAAEFLKLHGKESDKRSVVLAVALKSRTLEKDASMEDGVFRIVVGKNEFPNGEPLSAQ